MLAAVTSVPVAPAHREDSRPGLGGNIAECNYPNRRAGRRLASGKPRRALRRASGTGLYRYTAFGRTKEDTSTIVQPLRWKARWHSTLNGAEVYDVRARQWAPEIGAFISVGAHTGHRDPDRASLGPRNPEVAAAVLEDDFGTPS